MFLRVTRVAKAPGGMKLRLLLLRSRLISWSRPSNAFMEILLILLWAMVRLNTTGSLPNDFFSSLVKLLWSRLKVRKD